MSGERLTSLADRKALLRARAELDRTRLAFAVAEIRAVVAPAHDASHTASLRPTAAMIIGIIAPAFGAKRVARWLRYTSLALTAYRIAKNWRRTR
jgi:hypothetical protein